jgi:hypothetical protein
VCTVPHNMISSTLYCKIYVTYILKLQDEVLMQFQYRLWKDSRSEFVFIQFMRCIIFVLDIFKGLMDHNILKQQGGDLVL